MQGITPAGIGLGDSEAYIKNDMIKNDMPRLSPLLANIAQSKG